MKNRSGTLKGYTIDRSRFRTGASTARIPDLPLAANEMNNQQQATRAETHVKLQEILRAVAHDLRTPLSTIMNCAAILRENAIDPGGATTQIRNSAERMAGLIESMLERARESDSRPKIQWVDMPRLLERVRNEVILSQPDGTSRATIKIGSAPWVLGDPIKLAQVFTNLISNAVKFSRFAEMPQVHVVGMVEDNEIHYVVSDNGVGIVPSGAGELFKPFKRLDNARSFEGTGVGLSIVKEIMERSNGRIWYTSIPFVETSFHLVFPKGPAVEDDQRQ
jgi:two-component system, chemotaxis family, sensor kinase Cph1